MKLELELIAISHISKLLCAFQLILAVFTKNNVSKLLSKTRSYLKLAIRSKKNRNVHHQTGRYHVGTKYDFCQKKVENVFVVITWEVPRYTC